MFVCMCERASVSGDTHFHLAHTKEGYFRPDTLSLPFSLSLLAPLIKGAERALCMSHMTMSGYCMRQLGQVTPLILLSSEKTGGPGQGQEEPQLQAG